MATHASERIRPGNARRARDLAAVGLRRGDGVLRGSGRVDQPAGAVVMARRAPFLAVALLPPGIARSATPPPVAMVVRRLWWIAWAAFYVLYCTLIPGCAAVSIRRESLAPVLALLISTPRAVAPQN